jgi:hypothetical protein
VDRHQLRVALVVELDLVGSVGPHRVAAQSFPGSHLDTSIKTAAFKFE